MVIKMIWVVVCPDIESTQQGIPVHWTTAYCQTRQDYDSILFNRGIQFSEAI